MTLYLPPELRWLGWIAGAAWPDGDEDRTWDVSRAWSETATELRDLLATIDEAKKATLEAYSQGEAREEMGGRFDQLRTGEQSLETLANYMQQVADSTFDLGTELQAHKLTIIVTLCWLAIEIAWAWMFPPTAVVVEQAAILSTRSILKVIQDKLQNTIANLAARLGAPTVKRHFWSSLAKGRLVAPTAKGWGVGISRVAEAVTVGAAINGSIQVGQLAAGKRRNFNSKEFGFSLLGGAVGAIPAREFGRYLGHWADKGLNKFSMRTGLDLNNVPVRGVRGALVGALADGFGAVFGNMAVGVGIAATGGKFEDAFTSGIGWVGGFAQGALVGGARGMAAYDKPIPKLGTGDTAALRHQFRMDNPRAYLWWFTKSAGDGWFARPAAPTPPPATVPALVQQNQHLTGQLNSQLQRGQQLSGLIGNNNQLMRNLQSAPPHVQQAAQQLHANRQTIDQLNHQVRSGGPPPPQVAQQLQQAVTRNQQLTHQVSQMSPGDRAAVQQSLRTHQQIDANRQQIQQVQHEIRQHGSTNPPQAIRQQIDANRQQIHQLNHQLQNSAPAAGSRAALQVQQLTSQNHQLTHNISAAPIDVQRAAQGLHDNRQTIDRLNQELRQSNPANPQPVNPQTVQQLQHAVTQNQHLTQQVNQMSPADRAAVQQNLQSHQQIDANRQQLQELTHQLRQDPPPGTTQSGPTAAERLSDMLGRNHQLAQQVTAAPPDVQRVAQGLHDNNNAIDQLVRQGGAQHTPQYQQLLQTHRQLQQQLGNLAPGDQQLVNRLLTTHRELDANRYQIQQLWTESRWNPMHEPFPEPFYGEGKDVRGKPRPIKNPLTTPMPPEYHAPGGVGSWLPDGSAPKPPADENGGGSGPAPGGGGPGSGGSGGSGGSDTKPPSDDTPSGPDGSGPTDPWTPPTDRPLPDGYPVAGPDWHPSDGWAPDSGYQPPPEWPVPTTWSPPENWVPPTGWVPPATWPVPETWSLPPGYVPPPDWHPPAGWPAPTGWTPPPGWRQN